LFYLHEGPFVVAAVRKLKEIPNFICFDAHGEAHPSRGGLATTCGKILGIPSIGIAKTHLIGEEVPYRNGLKRLECDDRVIGYVTEEPKRYWSAGFSTRVEDVEKIIQSRTAHLCLKALRLAHAAAKQGMALDPSD
jgi:deoxyinosine 3'endonuclease (endonuclease V)